MNPNIFAYNEYRDYVIYQSLAKIETNHEFKKILEELIEHEAKDFAFWKQFASTKKFRVSLLTIFFLRHTQPPAPKIINIARMIMAIFPQEGASQAKTMIASAIIARQ